MSNPHSETDFFLIHGGAHGAWCWERVTPLLEASPGVGKVIAADLLDDAIAATGKPFDEIALQDYITGALQRIEQAGLDNIVLVGHSMAGITMPSVAHHIPGKIRHVVYATTSNPVAGQSIADLMKHPLSPLSRNLSTNEMFYNDLDADTARWLKRNLRRDPPKPFSDKVPVSDLPEGIPSTYILCEQDLALPVDYQLEQAENAGADEIVRIDAGHSVFASQPEAFTRILLRYV